MTGDTADRLVAQVARDWRLAAGLSPADQALCAYAEKLTRAPAALDDADIAALREHGFDDRAIHDATQIIGYFNYINRIAGALDVELEDFVQPWEQLEANRLTR